MFELNAAWSLLAHLFPFSEWSAYCTHYDNPSSCTNALQNPDHPSDFGGWKAARRKRAGPPIYAWIDLTYLPHKDGVSWGYRSSCDKALAFTTPLGNPRTGDDEPC
jgi:hypothetical protein